MTAREGGIRANRGFTSRYSYQTGEIIMLGGTDLRTVFSLILIVTLLAGVLGLGAMATAAAKQEEYIEVSALGNLDYFYDHKLGMEMVGKALNVKTSYVGPPDYDMNAMIAAFEQAIAKKPAGIVVVGFDEVLTPIVDKAIDQGIPVVTVDADLPNSKRIAFVGTGNYQAGYQGGLKLASLIGGKGKVAIVGIAQGAGSGAKREGGFQDTIKKEFPGIQVVGLN